MSSSSVDTMTRSSLVPSSGTVLATDAHSNRTSLCIRDLINENNDIYSSNMTTIDEEAFLQAQRHAFAVINDAALARALQESEQTAAREAERRRLAARYALVSPNELGQSSSAAQVVPAKRASDEATARSLARTWQVATLQPALMESSPSPSASTSIPPPTSTNSASNSAAASIQSKPSQSSTQKITKMPSSGPSSSSYSHSHSSRVITTTRAESISQPDAPKSLSKQKHTSKSPSGLDVPYVASSDRQSMPNTYLHDSTSTAKTAPRSTTRESSAPVTIKAKKSQVTPPRPIESKASSASARDLRLGLTFTPSLDSVSSPSNSRSQKRRVSPEPEPRQNRDFFTATRGCSNCGTPIEAPRGSLSVPSEPFSHTFLRLLHATCFKCSMNHCRGCFRRLERCPSACRGGKGCEVKNCCSQVCAITIFEVLSSFDAEYSAHFAGQGTKDVGAGKQERHEYLELVISRSDKSTRPLEAAVIRTLHTLCSWLQLPTAHELRFHPTITRLFTLSFLPEVIYTFLQNNNVGDWLRHSEIYALILTLLRRLVDCGLSQLLSEPLLHIEQSCGLQRWIWDQGLIEWESDMNNQPALSPPIRHLVSRLEAHRVPLMAFGATVKFSATKDKVHTLCDGISYLLLQQVVAFD